VRPKLTGLRQPGPSTVAYESLTRRAMARLDAPMAQVDSPCRGLVVAPGRERKDPRDIGPQLRLVFFDAHAILPALVDHRLRHVAWGQEGLHGDHPTVQDQGR
jgi:hypothetical protein